MPAFDSLKQRVLASRRPTGPSVNEDDLTGRKKKRGGRPDRPSQLRRALKQLSALAGSGPLSNLPGQGKKSKFSIVPVVSAIARGVPPSKISSEPTMTSAIKNGKEVRVVEGRKGRRLEFYTKLVKAKQNNQESGAPFRNAKEKLKSIVKTKRTAVQGTPEVTAAPIVIKEDVKFTILEAMVPHALELIKLKDLVGELGAIVVSCIEEINNLREMFYRNSKVMSEQSAIIENILFLENPLNSLRALQRVRTEPGTPTIQELDEFHVLESNRAAIRAALEKKQDYTTISLRSGAVISRIATNWAWRTTSDYIPALAITKSDAKADNTEKTFHDVPPQKPVYTAEDYERPDDSEPSDCESDLSDPDREENLPAGMTYVGTRIEYSFSDSEEEGDGFSHWGD